MKTAFISFMAATSIVPVSKNALPLVFVGLGPPLASWEIASTPRLAILPGYCVESEANWVPTSLTPGQLPSIV